MNALRHLLLCSLCSLFAVAVACSGDDGGEGPDGGGAGDDVLDVLDDSSVAAPDAPDAPETTDDDAPVQDVSDRPPVPPGNPDCDGLIELDCALPWPSSLYLVADEERATGVTLAFGPTSLPKNFEDIHIDPAPYRRMDGYGVNTAIVAHFPNLDVDELPDDYSVERSLLPDSPVLLFRVAESGLERVPFWVELDDWEEDPSLQVLYVRPGVILEEASRYVVAFRALSTTDGTPIAPTPAFWALRDGGPIDEPTLAARQERFEEVFELLSTAEVERDSLLLAWDFTTASSEAMHGPMLEIRRQGLNATGAQGPELVITEIDEFSPEEHDHWAAILRGHFRAPRFVREDVVEHPSGDAVGWVLNEVGGPGGPVQQNGWRDAEFWIGIPHSALDGTPHGLIQYGHGFFGSAEGTVARWTENGRIANEYGYIFFGSNWTGQDRDNFGRIQFAVFELSQFRWMSDYVHQGMLEFILFARAMRDRFPTLDEVTSRGVVVDPRRLYYSGISQGGIYGATYMALSPDITRGHLGVPGQNYSLMMHRSENFGDFFDAVSGTYPGRARQAVLTQVVQSLWESVDPGSYYRRITNDPFDGDPVRHVLLAPARGDHSVTTVAIEVVARSNVGVATLEGYDATRSIPLVTETPYPHDGSGIVLYAFENEWPPAGVNRPAPRGPTNVHDAPRRLEHHNAQMMHFFETGTIIDVCGGDGCTPD